MCLSKKILQTIILVVFLLSYNHLSANNEIIISEQINLNQDLYLIEANIPEKYQKIGINEFLSMGKSNFTWSIPSRIHNITVAANKFNWKIIAKWEVFSFNDTIESVHARYWYVKDQVIKWWSIVWEQGGWVCQLSTTILRAAMNAGLEIQQFRNHSYAISYYKPYWLDSAIYMPDLDLKFKNNSPWPIYIQTMIIWSELIAMFYWNYDGRKVAIKWPYINQNIKESDLAANLSIDLNNKKLDFKKFTVQYIRTIEYGSWKNISEIFSSTY